MSMHEWAINEYGIYLDDKDVCELAGKIYAEHTEGIRYEVVANERGRSELHTFDQNGYEEVWNRCDCAAYVQEFGHINFDYTGNFSGDALSIKSNEYVENFDDDSVYYIQLLKYPSFYHKCFENFEDMVEQHKKKYDKYLPEDFDWGNRLVHIVGTQWG